MLSKVYAEDWKKQIEKCIITNGNRNQLLNFIHVVNLELNYLRLIVQFRKYKSKRRTEYRITISHDS